MNQNDQNWLENRVHAAVDDDYYLDREEEKRIKEEGAAKGIPIKDIDLVIRSELQKSGSVCERILIDELERLLHQFTENDKRLDEKEERDALNKVLNPGVGKKRGLDPRIAEHYVISFCKVNGVTRDSDVKSKYVPIFFLALIGVFVIIGLWFSVNKKLDDSPKPDTPSGSSSLAIVSEKDKVEIDDQIRRAQEFIERAQFTDPPEKSAKACLDTIRRIDPAGRYRALEIKAMASKIVEHYIALAGKSFAAKDTAAVTRWLERARLIGVDLESIQDKEREFGLSGTKK